MRNSVLYLGLVTREIQIPTEYEQNKNCSFSVILKSKYENLVIRRKFLIYYNLFGFFIYKKFVSFRKHKRWKMNGTATLLFPFFPQLRVNRTYFASTYEKLSSVGARDCKARGHAKHVRHEGTHIRHEDT